MTLVSGGIRLCEYSRRYPGEGASNDSGVVETRERQFSAFSLVIFSATLKMRPVSLHSNMQSVLGFSVITKCMTLNDPY